MIIDKHISLWRLLKVLWKQLLLMFFIASIIIVPIEFFGLEHLTIDMTTPLILGTALSIFLGFQTNSAYERWMRGRSLWGQMRSASRNYAFYLARVGEDYINHQTGKPDNEIAGIMKRMIRRNIAWIWAMDRQLKDISQPMQGVEHYLEKDELAQLKTSHNPALSMLFNQSKDFRTLQARGQFFDGEHFEIIACQREMVAGQTACEGLKNTPFPTHYTYFTRVFIWMLVVLVSFSLPRLEQTGYLAIPMTVMIGWVFSQIEGIGSYMDDPFINNRNVVPMDSLARNLERDLLAFGLGETENLPPVIEPVEGALY